jgi:hypothetical protein
MARTRIHRGPRVCLRLNPLEARLTPAGTVTATQSGAVLTLTGTDDSESVRLTQAAGSITLTGLSGTAIVGGPVFAGVTSVKTVMKGGDDQISIDDTLPFALTGAATFDLGDGNNSLTLNTNDTLSLASLTVKAGDGTDAISVGSNATAKATGNASFNLGAGGTALTLTNVQFQGAAGLKVTATDGNDQLTLIGVQGTGPVTVTTGNGSLGVFVGGGNFGSLTFSGGGTSPLISDQGVAVNLIGATVAGAVKVTSTAGADVTVTGGGYGSVSVTAGPLAQGRLTLNGGANVNGGLTAKGLDAQLTLNSGSSVTVSGDVAVLGTRFGQAVVSGSTLVAGGIRVTGSVPPAVAGGPVTITGSTVTVTRDVSVKGTQADFVIDNSTVDARSISLTGTESAAFRPPASPTGPGTLALSGSLTVNAPEATFRFAEGSAIVSGNLKVTGTRETTFDMPAGSGPQVSVTGALTVQGGSGVLGLVVGGGSLTVGTDLTAKGTALNEIQLTPGLTSKVGRNLSLTLGATDELVRVNADVQVAGNLTVNAGAGNNVVLLGAPGGPAGPTVGKNLSVTTQGGNDVVSLTQVTVTGTTTVKTGAGSDLLAILGPSTFTGATTIDLGAGDDRLAVANDPATTSGPVTFAGTVNAQLGAGNDSLFLGLAPGSGGNGSTAVAFSTSSANKIDGGAGLNFFDDEAAQTTGTVATLHFTDPTP